MDLGGDPMGSSLTRRQRQRRRCKRNRKRKEAEMELDRISALPDHLLHHVLSFLPTKIAIQTSLLSSRWRNVWAATPTLHFDNDDDDDGGPTSQPGASSHSLLDFAHLTLRYRDPTAPLRSLRFFNYDYDDEDDATPNVGALVDRAVEYSIQELHLHVLNVSGLPPSIFTLASLRVLALGLPSVCWPPSASLPALEMLSLSDVDFFEDPPAPDFVARSCPRLKQLSMQWVRGLTKLEMDCPLLEGLKLYYLGGVERIRIISDSLTTLKIRNGSIEALLILTPNLKKFRWANVMAYQVSMQRPIASLSSTRIDFRIDLWDCSSSDALAGAAALILGVLDTRRLDITWLYPLGEGVLKGHIEHPAAPTYSGLEYLCLCSPSESFDTMEVLGMAFLLKFASNLKILKISRDGNRTSRDDNDGFGPHFITRRFGRGGFWDSQSLSLKRLSCVHISGAEGTPYEIDFVEFLLRTVTTLRELTIKMSETADYVDWLKIRKTPRASSSVKLSLFDNSGYCWA